jgi:uracil-DNA glycosylase family 4
MEKWSREWKLEQLSLLKAEWAVCQKCPLCEGRKNVVFGEGNPEAQIIMISEAPGEEEDKSGIPFIGNSGVMLNSMLKQVDIDRKSLYITNILGCKTPKNRDPISTEIAACMDRVYRIIYLIDPILIVSLGKVALQALVGGRWSVNQERGKIFSSPFPAMKTTGERNGVSVPGVFFPKKGENKKEFTLDYDLIPILHPSFILKESPQKADGTFLIGGEAHRTMDDLNHIKSLVERFALEQSKTKIL